MGSSQPRSSSAPPPPTVYYAPGQNAEEDARLNKEHLEQQKKRKLATQSAVGSLLNGLQGSTEAAPNLASRRLIGY